MNEVIEDEIQLLVLSETLEKPKNCLLCLKEISGQFAALRLLPDNILYFDYSCFRLILGVGLKYTYQEQAKEVERKN